MKRIAWVFLGWLALLTTVQAASFDCSKALSKAEKLICSDIELSSLDEELAAIYKSMHQDGVKVDALIESQKQWLKERDDAANLVCLRDGCSVTAFVKLKYENRLAALTSSTYFFHECEFPSRLKGFVYSDNGGEWEKPISAPGNQQGTILQNGFFRFIFYIQTHQLFVEAWQKTDGVNRFAGCIEIKDKEIMNSGAYNFKFSPADSFSAYLNMEIPERGSGTHTHKVRVPFYFIWNVL